MTMQITDAQLQTIVAKAIFENIPAEKREEMLTKAITSLLQVEERGGYNAGYRRTSHLERVFQAELEGVARTIVAEYVQRPDVRKRIEGVAIAALDKAFAEPSGSGDGRALVDKLAQGIAHAFTYHEK